MKKIEFRRKQLDLDWRAFWDRPNAVYAGERHLRAHYHRLFTDLEPLLPPAEAKPTIVDFGCGDALMADRLAARAERVFLCDASPLIRQRVAHRFRAHPRLTVCSDADLAAMGSGSVDLCLVISVVQYLTRPSLTQLLAEFRRLLKAHGSLIIADVIPPDASV